MSIEDDFDFGQSDPSGIDTEEKRDMLKRLTEDDFPYNEKGFNGLDRINQRDSELDKNTSFSGIDTIFSLITLMSRVQGSI